MNCTTNCTTSQEKNQKLQLIDINYIANILNILTLQGRIAKVT